MSIIAELAKYPFPSFLEGRCTPSVYLKWLDKKATTLLKRDKQRRKPYALNVFPALYKQKIHDAVTSGGQYDPYTGESLAWELISKWDSSHTLPLGRLE
jgi:hypothetical protein